MPIDRQKLLDTGLMARIYSTDVEHILNLSVGRSLQSAIDLSDARNLIFPYIRLVGRELDRRFDQTSTVKALSLGGGAYSIPRYINAKWGESHQVVVEIDRNLIDLIESVAPVSGDISVIAEDAKQYLLNSDSDDLFDFIFVDIFTEATPPDYVLTKDFYELLMRKTCPGGLIAINIVDNENLYSLYEHLKAASSLNTPATVEIMSTTRSDSVRNIIIFLERGAA